MCRYEQCDEHDFMLCVSQWVLVVVTNLTGGKCVNGCVENVLQSNKLLIH